jgi:PAS domain S-box-containing protein/putative nucleotidyltransferase with HDIG domain
MALLSFSGCKTGEADLVLARPNEKKGPSSARKVEAFDSPVIPEQPLPRDVDGYFRLLAESLPVGVSIMDQEENCIYLNPKFTEWFGYTVEDIPTVRAWFAKAYPDEPTRREAVLAWTWDEKKSEAGEFRPVISDVTCKDGSRKTVSSRFVVTDEGERFILYENISEGLRIHEALRESEARLRDIIEHSTNLLYSHTAGHMLTYLSPQTREYLDCEPEEALVRWTEFVTDHPVNKEGFLQTQRAIDTGVRQPPYELELIGKKGRKIWVEVSESPVVRDGKTVAVVGALTDITARRKAEKALQESEEKYRTILDSIEEGYLEMDLSGSFTFFSSPLQKITGYPKDELLGMKNRALHTPDTAKRVHQTFNEIYRTGKPAFLDDCEVIRKDGSVIIVSISASLMLDPNDQPVGFRCLVRDVTGRKLSEKALKDREQQYRLLADNVTDIICITDLNLRFTYVSPSVTRTAGYSVDEMIHATFESLFTPESVENAKSVLAQVLAFEESGQQDDGGARTIVLEGYRKDGSKIWLEVRATFLRGEKGEPVSVLSIARDITDRKLSEEALRESEQRYRQLFDHAPTGIYELDFSKGKFLSVNDVMCGYTGYTKEELLSLGPSDILTEESQKIFLERMTKIFSGEKVPETVEFKIRTKDRRELWALLKPQIFFENGLPKRATVVVHDITEHKLSEEALRESEEKYRLLVNNANDAIFIAQDGRIKFPNPKTLEILGYTADELNSVPYTDLIHPDDREILIQERLTREKEGAGGASTYSLRILNRAGHHLWAQISSVLILWEGRKATLNFVRDITVQRLAEEKLRQTVSRLRKITGATIQAIAQTVEVRDPYTAGHQRRVSDLARALASEMGLPSDQVDGVRLAGVIHDIGKISVPAEILSKPGILNDLEFALIKTHPQVGYEILKDIEFPWDIATIVLQHHERMDGSGYPQGLSGEAILLESRILAVADVVEAMASHRPYRPALGIVKALDEITIQRGLAYDAQVVDACLRLFVERNFALRS